MGIDLEKEAAFWNHLSRGREDDLAKANREAMEWRETAQEEHGKVERLERENARLREALQEIADLGINTEGYMRSSLTVDRQKYRQAVQNARRALEYTPS